MDGSSMPGQVISRGARQAVDCRGKPAKPAVIWIINATQKPNMAGFQASRCSRRKRMRRKMSQRCREMYKEVRQSDDQRILKEERRKRMDVIARSNFCDEAISTCLRGLLRRRCAAPRNDKINQRMIASNTRASLRKNKA